MSRWPADRLDPAAYPVGIDLPVFFNDLDVNGHLNNVALGRFFEHARVIANRGRQPEGEGRFLVARVAIDYLAEGRLTPELHVRTRTGRLGSSSVTLEQGAWQGETCVGLCETVLVHLHADRPAALPDQMRAAFTA